MEALFKIVENELIKHNITNYHMTPVLIKVGANVKRVIDVNNDLYFFANAYTTEGIIDGQIRGSGGGNALVINPIHLASQLFKHQLFKGLITIKNLSLDNVLCVELLRVTPVI